MKKQTEAEQKLRYENEELKKSLERIKKVVTKSEPTKYNRRILTLPKRE